MDDTDAINTTNETDTTSQTTDMQFTTGFETEPANETCARLDDSSSITLLSLTVIYFAGLFICATLYILYWALVMKFKVHSSVGGVTTASKYGKLLRGYMRQLKSGDTISGKILISMTLLFNLVYMALAIYRSLPPKKIEECISITDPAIIVELVVVIELLLFFLLRLLANNNLLLFWINGHTIVDVLTLPHIFITLAVGADFIGLRALRFLWLTQITTVLQFARLVRSQNVVDILNLMIYFVILWLSSSGILYVIEAAGDFWKEVSNASSDSVLVYVYLTMVTISTVGYGDFSPNTSTGRAFMIVFIIAGLAFFAAILPQLVDVVVGYYTRTEFSRFDTSRVPRHVIVCGHITAVTAEDFLKDFLHPDRGDTQTHVLFLHPERPDKDLRDVLRTYYTRVQYLLGTVLNGDKLHKAKVFTSSAVFILANKHTNNPKEEDHANMLRVVSVKNTTKKIPIIIQLLHSFSKRKVSEIDGWVSGRDIAVCLNELKLGILAQSCLCPGFSTLIANLFYASDFHKFPFWTHPEAAETDQWKEPYIKGASNEIYSAPFSQHFEGKKFHQAAAICYNKLNLVLVAVEHIKQTHHVYYINPSSKTHREMVIEPKGMLGYFLAPDQRQVYNVSEYCECCPGHRHHLASKASGQDVKMQLHSRRQSGSIHWLNQRSYSLTRLEHYNIPTYDDDFSVHIVNKSTKESPIPLQKMVSNGVRHQENGANGSTVPAQESVDGQDDVITPADSEVKTALRTAKFFHDSSLEGSDDDEDEENEEDELQEDGDFQVHVCDPMPLDDCTLNPDLLSITDLSYRTKARSIKNHVVLCLFANGDSPLLGLHNFLKPLRNKHLPLESIKPVVIVCERAFIEKEWPIIRNIPKVYHVDGSPLLWTNLRAARVRKCSVCVVLTSLPNVSYHDPAINDKEVILCSLSIQKRLKKLNKKALIITDLRQESNVQFLDFGDEDKPDERIYKAQPFACGEAFSASMFDSVTSSVYHGPGTLHLVEDLIHSAGTKTLCQVVSMPIYGTNFSGRAYGEFYNAQLKENNICLGIYRKLPSSDTQSYVISCPDSTLVLNESDTIFMLTEV